MAPTVYPNSKCFQVGRFAAMGHLIKCYGLRLEFTFAELVAVFLGEMASATCVPNPGRPTPAGSFFEMELNMVESGDEEELFTGGDRTLIEIWGPDDVTEAIGVEGEQIGEDKGGGEGATKGDHSPRCDIHEAGAGEEI